jgi:hypothetical protein
MERKPLHPTPAMATSLITFASFQIKAYVWGIFSKSRGKSRAEWYSAFIPIFRRDLPNLDEPEPIKDTDSKSLLAVRGFYWLGPKSNEVASILTIQSLFYHLLAR